MRVRTSLVAISLLWAPQTVTGECRISSNYTIIDLPDVPDSISSCKTIDGAVSLLFGSSPSAWSSDKAAVDLGNVGTITGDLGVYPDSLSEKTEVSALGLQDVGGALTIQNINTKGVVGKLSIAFPLLKHVGSDYVITGGIADISLQHTQDVHVERMYRVYDTQASELTLGGVNEVDGDFSIDSHSNLKTLEVSNLATAGKALDIKNNGALTKVTLPKLKSVGSELAFYQNPELTRLEIPALESADTISWSSNGNKPAVSFPRLSSLGTHNTTSTSTFEDVRIIQFASLRNITGYITFQNTALDVLVVPLVKTIKGGITIQDNADMTTFALPRVSKVGELTIKSNDALTNITANALASAGTISVKGSFKNVEFFGLKEVTGDFKVVGGDSMDCSWFDDNVEKIVKGEYICVGNRDKPASEITPSTGGIEKTEGNPQDYIKPLDGDDVNNGGNGSGGSGSGSGSGGSSDSKGSKGLSSGAKAGIGVTCAILMIAIIAVAVFFFLRRRRPMEEIPSETNSITKEVESDTNSEYGVYGGHKGMGVHTTIQSDNPRPAPPSLGVLDFVSSPFLDTKDMTSSSAWKTIRRVSNSSGESKAGKATKD